MTDVDDLSNERCCLSMVAPAQSYGESVGISSSSDMRRKGSAQRIMLDSQEASDKLSQ